MTLHGACVGILWSLPLFAYGLFLETRRDWRWVRKAQATTERSVFNLFGSKRQVNFASPVLFHVLAVADLYQHRNVHRSCFFGYSLSTDGRDTAQSDCAIAELNDVFVGCSCILFGYHVRKPRVSEPAYCAGDKGGRGFDPLVDACQRFRRVRVPRISTPHTRNLHQLAYGRHRGPLGDLLRGKTRSRVEKNKMKYAEMPRLEPALLSWFVIHPRDEGE